MSDLQVKLFGVVSLDLVQVEGTGKEYQLPEPMTDISKQKILFGLVDQLNLPSDLLSYLPERITIENLYYKASFTPAEVQIGMQIQPEFLFEHFGEIVKVSKSLLELYTTTKILIHPTA